MADNNAPKMPIVVTCKNKEEADLVFDVMKRLKVAWINGRLVDDESIKANLSGYSFPIGLLPLMGGIVDGAAVELFYQLELKTFLEVAKEYDNPEDLYDFLIATRDLYIIDSICIKR